MPIKIPDNLPAREILEKERVFLMSEKRAATQDIRPMRIALLNLMPTKVKTETQLLRALGNTPLQVEMTLIRPGTHESQNKNTPIEHLLAFYKTFDEVRDERFDALIVTGAPVAHLPFEDVTYWPELARIFDWARTQVYSCFFICWGAQAALYHYHGTQRTRSDTKHFGIFDHQILLPFHPLIAGFDDTFPVPVSRYTEMPLEKAKTIPGLAILAANDRTGVCLAYDEANRRVYMFNHLEYDADTLASEYFRDEEAGLGTKMPENYFPGDDPAKAPPITWRAHRTLLFTNWINMVYQGTPYDLNELPVS
jgi:homoserine O-succinyltransferase